MPTATQELVNGFNLELAIYKNQILQAYKNLTVATSNKNITNLLWNNFLNSPDDPAFDLEGVRLKNIYAQNSYEKSLVIDCMVSQWKKSYGNLSDQTYFNPDLGQTVYYLGSINYFSGMSSPCKMLLSSAAIYWNSFPFWKDVNKSYANLLSVQTSNHNLFQSKVEADAAYAQAIQDYDNRKAEITAWLSTYNAYANFTAPTFDNVLDDALAVEMGSLATHEAVYQPQAALVPETQVPASIPVIPLPETSLPVLEATRISNESGPSVELQSAPPASVNFTQNKIALTPSPSNTSALLAGAAILGYFMMKKKRA